MQLPAWLVGKQRKAIGYFPPLIPLSAIGISVWVLEMPLFLTVHQGRRENVAWVTVPGSQPARLYVASRTQCSRWPFSNFIAELEM